MGTSLVCYKYRSGAAALRSLSEGTLYFASPQELNDSLEAKFDFASTAQFSRVFNSTLKELALLRGHTGDLSPVEQVPIGLESVNEKANQRFSAGCEQVGIFSAASRSDNQPMWAYYCANSHGVCFHLEFSEEILKKYQLYPTEVTYTRESRIHNRAEDFRQLLLELGEQNPTWTMTQLTAFSMTEKFRRRWGVMSTARAISTKHADWEHEQEIRILAPRAGPMPLVQDALKSVIFMRTDFPEWGAIMMLLHRLYPNVRLADMKFSHKEPFVQSRLLTKKMVPVGEDADAWPW